MNNSTEISGLKLSDRILNLLRTRNDIIAAAGCFIAGTVISLAKIIGDPAPFGAALVAAIPGGLLLPSALGSALGYLIGGTDSYREVTSVLIITLVRFFIGTQKWEKNRRVAAPLLTAFSVFLAGIIPELYSSPLIYDIIMWVTQIIMAGAAASFMHRACWIMLPDFAKVKKELLTYDERKMAEASAAVVIALLLMGLDSAQIAGVTLGRIACTLAVLIYAKTNGEKGSALAGVVCGLVIGFSTGDFSIYVTAFSLGGLMAGLFAAFERRGAAFAFGSVYGCLCLLTGRKAAGFIEVAIAVMVFMLLPPTFFRRFAFTVQTQSEDFAFKRVVEDRLRLASAALREMSQTTRDVAKKLRNASPASFTEIYDRTAKAVCSRCPYNLSCWQEKYGDTTDALRNCIQIIQEQGRIDTDYFPVTMDRCIHKDKIAFSLENEYALYNSRSQAQIRAARVRSVVTDQFDSIALVLAGIVDSVAEVKSMEKDLNERFMKVFTDQRLDPSEVLCWRDTGGRISIRASIPVYRDGKVKTEIILRQLSEVSGVEFDIPEKKRSGSVYLYSFSERPKYSVKYGCCQIKCAGNSICGDTVRYSLNRGGKADLLLSDGMGNGKSAALDSVMASSLAVRLLDAKLSYRSVLRLINSALLVKSGEESLATLDAASIDLYSGRLQLFKAGAAPTVVRKEGRGMVIESTSLPAGIVEGVEFEQSEISLSEGDMVLMLSDGATVQGCDWIVKAAENIHDTDLDEFCRKLARTAQLRRTDGREDDITVAAITICENTAAGSMEGDEIISKAS